MFVPKNNSINENFLSCATKHFFLLIFLNIFPEFLNNLNNFSLFPLAFMLFFFAMFALCLHKMLETMTVNVLENTEIQYRKNILKCLERNYLAINGNTKKIKK